MEIEETDDTANKVNQRPPVWGLFKNVRDARRAKTEPRGVYLNTLSGAVCGATQQTMCPSGYIP